MIVGKRALPAAVGVERAGPHDVVMAIAYGGPTVDGAVDIAIADHAVPGARHLVALPAGRRRHAAKEAALVAYHLLWELVHVFLDAGAATGGGSDALDALYPMISAGRPAPRRRRRGGRLDRRHKLAETAALRAASLAANADADRPPPPS